MHEYNGKTGDFIVCDGLRPFNPTGLGSAGIPPEELEKFSEGGYAVCRPGSWDPVERLKDMDLDGLRRRDLLLRLRHVAVQPPRR